MSQLEALLDNPAAQALINHRARELAQRRLDAANSDLRDAEWEVESLRRQLALKTTQYEEVAELLAAELRAPVDTVPFAGEHLVASPRTRLTVHPGGAA